MSLIITKVKQLWATTKSKIRNEPNQVRMVQPIRSMDSDDDKKDVETEHLRIYRTIWRLIDLLASVIGLNVYKEVELSRRLIFTFFVLGMAYISLSYTTVLVWTDHSTLLEVICLFGITLPSTLKFRLALTKMKEFLSINKFFENMLISNLTGRRAHQLTKELRDALKHMKIFIAISVLCMGVLVFYPTYGYVAENRLIMIARMEYPFLDQTTTKGYIIGVGIISLMAVMAILGSVGFDSAILIYLLQYGSLVTQLILDFEDYHEMWTNKDEFSPQYRDHFLKNIFKKYQDTISYLRFVDDLFSANICHSICLLYLSLICSVCAVFNNGWISGYGFVIFSLVQLYIPCILGTYVNDQNERMNQAIYFIPWYEYPVTVQKSILILLHATSFNTLELWIGVLAPLNVETGLQITKSIFSYYTAMSNLM